MTETLLINFLFLLFPVLMYVIFFENRVNRHNYKTLLFIFAAISMVLSMSFPIRLELGFIYDLRYIPFLLGSLFGGYAIAFPLYVILNLYRFIVGGDGIFLSLLFSTIVFIVVPLYSRRFLELEPVKRIQAAVVIAMTTTAFYLSTLALFYESLNREFWLSTAHLLTIYFLGTAIIMVIIEKIFSNIKVRERMMESERLNVISELSASISHEIRNPLTVTSGFLQLLTRSDSLGKNDRRYVDLSMQEVKRAETIVTDFLSLAKPQAENMVTSDLKAEADYVNNIMIPYAKMHRVDVNFSFSNTLETTFDRNQLKQTLINLYKNGVEAVEEGSRGKLDVSISSRDQKIVIRIEDNGRGMSREEIARIGKPYYSTKKEGTGLGMLMVFSTINKLGGRIKVDSEKGKGTVFTITIPVRKNPAEAGTKPS
ncbi:ATP-binding protein [Alteribacter natronophilus]|uniref:ATP-binding protein n=1 Tax=Alteribacter natronophilus TaxID=2583810 RepID=UPI00110E23DE|nr:ATP-binding protein [Alteribacter natronophilus]TMW70353.1 GHKL domain-containing protein [Alteribacter natronophilus]